MTCSICLDNTDKSCYKAYCCKNKFHFECLEKWFKINNTCPLCRREYSHMTEYNNEFEEYTEKLQNINMKNVINNISENITLYKYQFEELNCNTLSNLFNKAEQILDVFKEFYDDDN